MTNKTPRPTWEVTIKNPGYDPNRPVVRSISVSPDRSLSPEEQAETIRAFHAMGNPNVYDEQDAVEAIRKWARKHKVACHYAGYRHSGDTEIIVRWYDAEAAMLFKVAYGGAL